MSITPSSGEGERSKGSDALVELASDRKIFEQHGDASQQTTVSGYPEIEKAASPGSSASSVAMNSAANPAEGFRGPEKQYIFPGAVFQGPTSFGNDRAVDRPRTWAEELKEARRCCLGSSAEESDPIFDAACDALAHYRIVVLRYHPGERRRAEELMHRIAYWASDKEPARQLLSTRAELSLSLRDLALPDSWQSQHSRSLIYLTRRTEPHTAIFFSISNGVEVKALDERLEKVDARLLVSLAAQWDAVEGADPFDDCIRTLEVTCPRRTAMPAVEREAGSPFDEVPRIVAGLFPGLKVGEYQDLVNQFLPMFEPQTVTPPQSDGHKSGAAPFQPPHTLQQRWTAGDIDRVLTELGIRYVSAPASVGADPDENRVPGYYLADDKSPYADPSWIVANYPALLTSRMDRLLARYLGNDASERYQEGFLTCLARLEVTGAHTVDAQWLLRGWSAILDAQGNVDLAARNLCTLVEYVQAGHTDSEERLASCVIDGLADMAAELELDFQREVGDEPLRRAAALHEQGALSGPVNVWGWLEGSSAIGAAAKRFSEKQAAATWAMFRLARRWPTQVAMGMAGVLTRVTSPDSAWCLLGRNWGLLDQVPRCAALNFEHLLSQLLDSFPRLWVAFAHGVADAYGGPVREAIVGPPTQLSTQTRTSAIKGQRLAFACLYGVAPRIYRSDDETRQHVLKMLCPADSETANRGSVLGYLLAMSYLPVSEDPMLGPVGEGSPSLADIVRFLREMALVIQGDESMTPGRAINALAGLSSGLRALLPLGVRRALISQARESLDSQLQLRDHFETVSDRAALADMRKRIRATQAVLRSLNATK